MSQSTQSANKSQNHSKDKHQSHAYGKVWLFFMYYWIIFGIGCYFGQYLPMSWKTSIYSVICYFTGYIIYKTGA